MATNTPHSPYLVPASYSKPYRALGLSDEDARIYGMIANIDDNVGRLLAKLEELGISENTALIFLTDNGPTTQHFTAGLRGQKGTVYEGGIRVPFFVRWPAKLRPAKVDQIAAHIDVVPTLLEAAGIDPPAGLKLDGVSLMPLLTGANDDWPERTLYIQWQRGISPSSTATSPRSRSSSNSFRAEPSESSWGASRASNSTTSRPTLESRTPSEGCGKRL